MKLFSTLAIFAAVAGVTHAQADEELWPKLGVGEIKFIDGVSKVYELAAEAAGFGAGVPARGDIKFTFFKAPHGHDFLIISPCCGENGNGARLFQFSNAVVQPVDLVMGDPRVGFTAQGQAGNISVDDGAVALRARISFSECEQGVWSYYYRFDAEDRLTLLSVIDTSCEHLGVRELYHIKDVDIGHWWLH